MSNDYNLEDYRNAPSGVGPLAFEWKDKPHRLVYDLIRRIDTLEAENARLRAEKEAVERERDDLKQMLTGESARSENRWRGREKYRVERDQLRMELAEARRQLAEAQTDTDRINHLERTLMAGDPVRVAYRLDLGYRLTTDAEWSPTLRAAIDVDRRQA